MKPFCGDKVIQLLDKFPIVVNKARKKFVVSFILSMIKMRAVQFCEIAQGLNDAVKATSNETRIQDFFREVKLNYAQVALLLAMFLPRKGLCCMKIWSKMISPLPIFEFLSICHFVAFRHSQINEFV